VSVFAADTRLDNLLKSVESRYNRAKTLQVIFTESFTAPGRSRATESGILMLRKPLRMRWDYNEPKGKLFLSDAKNLWLYTPAANRVEKMKLQESDDMRVPLAFLLGKLNFDKEFKNIRIQQEGMDTRIFAEPKSENLPYSEVQFVVTIDYQIKEVRAVNFDRSVLEFHFDQERVDPPLDNKLFQFQMPKGAELVETSQ
jgi:outer membrane lipoprotein carrier protein